MCVEATSGTCENYEMSDSYIHPATWNRQTVQLLSDNFMIDEIYTRLAYWGKMCVAIHSVLAARGSYLITNGSNGHLCPRGHTSYHTYLQPPFNEIYLCNFRGDRREEPCPFELYKFQRIINKSK